MFNIYVSGATGLVGSAVVKNLKKAGYNVFTTRYDLLCSSSMKRLSKALSCSRVDLVIHCAGKVGGIKANSEDNEGFYNENFQMGSNLVRAAITGGVPHFINLASTCVYPTNVEYPLKEEAFFTRNAKLEPTNAGYAKAKRNVAVMVKNYFGDNGITLIPCNVYGIGDRYFDGSHVIPDLIQKFVINHHINCSTLYLYGTGRQEREFINSYDLAEIIKFVVQHIEQYGRTPYTLMNVANPIQRNIMTVATTIANLVGWTGTLRWGCQLGGIDKKPTDLTLLNEFIKDRDFEYTDFTEGLKAQIANYKELINNV